MISRGVKILFSISILVFTLNSCDEREARYPVKVSSGVDYKGSIELSKRINQKEEIRFREYLKTKDDDFKRSHFGFLYNIKNNKTVLIESGDEVLYSVIIENINGKVIYTKKTKSLIVDHQGEIKGVHEGLKLMSSGANATFLFPSHKAFGYTGNNRVYPNEPLIYTVHLKEIINKN